MGGAVKERPIIFGPDSVRAILAGRKTQTRRVIKPKPQMVDDTLPHNQTRRLHCPYGATGDRMWVKEPYRFDDFSPEEPIYQADIPEQAMREAGDVVRWRHVWFMPKRISRLRLEIVSIRVERVQDITTEEVAAEGVSRADCCPDHAPVGCYYDAYEARQAFAAGWNELNARRGFSWDSNPLVWVLTFSVLPQEAPRD